VEFGEAHVLDFPGDIGPVQVIHSLPGPEAAQQVGLIQRPGQDVTLVETIRHGIDLIETKRHANIPLAISRRPATRRCVQVQWAVAFISRRRPRIGGPERGPHHGNPTGPNIHNIARVVAPLTRRGDSPGRP
jgi:hypothetical protein